MSRFKVIHVSTLSSLWKVNKCVEPDLAKDWKHDPRVFHYLSLVNWKHLWVGRWSISIGWSLRKMQGLRVHRVPRRLHGVSWLRWILTWKTRGKHVVYHTESPKQSRAYWVANLTGISKKNFQTDCHRGPDSWSQENKHSLCTLKAEEAGSQLDIQ